MNDSKRFETCRNLGKATEDAISSNKGGKPSYGPRGALTGMAQSILTKAVAKPVGTLAENGCHAVEQMRELMTKK